jgi:hypothetical protein
MAVGAGRLNMEPWKVVDLHHFDEGQDPDTH